jgi:flagellar motor switch protein FliM
MLIRSQNKEVLIAFESLLDVEVSGGVISARRDMGWCCLLGEYSTKAKAMKVLDMIQEAYAKYKITCTFLTGFTGRRVIAELNDIHVNGFEELIKSFKKNMVFQMPEDSEVEV